MGYLSPKGPAIPETCKTGNLRAVVRVTKATLNLWEIPREYLNWYALLRTPFIRSNSQFSSLTAKWVEGQKKFKKTKMKRQIMEEQDKQEALCGACEEAARKKAEMEAGRKVELLAEEGELIMKQEWLKHKNCYLQSNFSKHKSTKMLCNSNQDLGIDNPDQLELLESLRQATLDVRSRTIPAINPDCLPQAQPITEKKVPYWILMSCLTLATLSNT